MASTTSLFTGLSGLSANARRLEVIGNNIANVNTTSFKSNRMVFAPTFNRDFSLGTAPSTASGGTNPGQVGLGVTIAGTQRNFNNGAISPTGINTDLAIDGNGFFIVERAGQQLYTRAGEFQFNSQNELVTLAGDRLQGFGVDDSFNLIEGKLVDLTVQVGTLTLAEATRNVNLSGNLRANGNVATQGSTIELASAGITAGTDLLTTIGGGAAVVVGDQFTLNGATRGDKTLPTAVFSVTATSTIDDLMAFLQSAMGIVPDGGFSAGDPTGGIEPGSYSVGAGLITLIGNFGVDNDIDINTANLTLSDATGLGKASPLTISKLGIADGESVRTTFEVFDSLGTSLQVDLTMVLAFTDSTGTYWRGFLHSGGDTDQALHLEQGDRSGTFSDKVPLLHFDNFGRLNSLPTINLELDRANTGALDPLNVSITFDSTSDSVTAISGDLDGPSNIAAKFQDGASLGTLADFSVGIDGVLTGGFTNGLTRTIGQLAIGSFTNPEGLIDVGNNLFRVGPNSGTPLETKPLQFGTGRIIGGALELSNVDLSQEFINMILTSTGYTASSRVIDTTNQLLQTLLVTGR